MWVIMEIFLLAQIYFGSPQDCPFVDQTVKHHFTGDKVPTLLAVCETDTCHIHSWLFYLLPCSNIYNVIHNFFHNFFSAPSAVSVAGGHQPAILSCRDGENFARATEQEERTASKAHQKKRTAGLCREYIRNRLGVCRIGKGKQFGTRQRNYVLRGTCF